MRHLSYRYGQFVLRVSKELGTYCLHGLVGALS
jgi:hypothetical protein